MLAEIWNRKIVCSNLHILSYKYTYPGNIIRSDKVNYFSIPKPNIKSMYKIINELKPSNINNEAQKDLKKNFINNKIINQNSKINNNIDFIKHN